MRMGYNHGHVDVVLEKRSNNNSVKKLNVTKEMQQRNNLYLLITLIYNYCNSWIIKKQKQIVYINKNINQLIHAEFCLMLVLYITALSRCLATLKLTKHVRGRVQTTRISTWSTKIGS